MEVQGRARRASWCRPARPVRLSRVEQFVDDSKRVILYQVSGGAFETKVLESGGQYACQAADERREDGLGICFTV